MSHTCRNGRKVLLEDTLLGIAVETHTPLRQFDIALTYRCLSSSYTVEHADIIIIIIIITDHLSPDWGCSRTKSKQNVQSKFISPSFAIGLLLGLLPSNSPVSTFSARLPVLSITLIRQFPLLSFTTSTIDLCCNLRLISSFLIQSSLVTPAIFHN